MSFIVLLLPGTRLEELEEQRIEEIRPLEARQVRGILEDEREGVGDVFAELLVAGDDVVEVESPTTSSVGSVIWPPGLLGARGRSAL